jgi:hypothetical protein
LIKSKQHTSFFLPNIEFFSPECVPGGSFIFLPAFICFKFNFSIKGESDRLGVPLRWVEEIQESMNQTI